MIKGSIQEEDTRIVNIYAPNIGAPQYIRQILTDIKGETDSNTIIVGDFNTPLTPMDRSSKQKINKETQVLEEMDLIDIFRTFHPNAEEYTFFSSAHRTFSRIDHQFSSVQFSRSIMSDSCDRMNRSTPGLPVHHHLLEFTQTHVHRVRDAIQPSHPLPSLSPTAPNPSQHQSLFQ